MADGTAQNLAQVLIWKNNKISDDILLNQLAPELLVRSTHLHSGYVTTGLLHQQTAFERF